MRSSKSRSRGNKNRSRHSNNNNNNGNNQNRVFDSSGPEGKVRGTPQQIIDKYNQLMRDATLANDGVAAENFQQHAEHYTRMLADSQREADARRETHEAQNRERQQQRDTERKERQEREGTAAPQQQPQAPQQQPDVAIDPASAPQPDMRPIDTPVADADNNTGLVETPESKPAPRKRTRRKPAPKPAADTADNTDGGEGEAPAAESPEAAE